MNRHQAQKALRSGHDLTGDDEKLRAGLVWCGATSTLDAGGWVVHAPPGHVWMANNKPTLEGRDVDKLLEEVDVGLEMTDVL